MVKKARILPAIATLALGIVAFSGANQANAYYVVNSTGVNDVQICHELSGIVAAGSPSFTFTLEPQSTDFDMSKVTLGSGNPTGTTINSASASAMSVTMPFAVTATPATQTQCVHLDFSGAGVINDAAQWGDKWIEITEASSDSTNFPASADTEELGFIYELNTNNGAPIDHGNGQYESKFSKKDDVTFSSSVNAQKTHITIDKEVRGNYARTDKDFTFTVNVTNGVTAATQYHVKVGNSTKTCNFGADCTFTLKHGETAYIGKDGNSDELYVGLYSYYINENPEGYTASYSVFNGGTAGSPVSGTRYPASGTKTLDDGEHLAYYNEKTDTPSGRFLVIFPFAVLAVAAGITIFAVRRTSKTNEEQA